MSDEKYIAFCLRCKAKKEVKEPVIKEMKTGMKAVSGTCPDCGCKMYKILPKNNPA